jgi:uncharacterized protein
LVAIDTVLIKLASRCNLDCDYCYVYHMGDDAWRTQPKRMPAAVIEEVGRSLGRLEAKQARPLSVVFHGGEPLLLGSEAFAHACRSIRRHLSSECGLHLQTNGILLTADVIDICAEHDIGISISIDGPAWVHDRHRKDHRGRPSHDKVMAAIGRLKSHPEGDRLFTGLLSVIDLAADPAEVYAFFKSIRAPSADFLYRDGNRDLLPIGKASLVSTEYGEWMVRLLEVYLDDPEPIRIRVLDDMLKLLLGGSSRKEGLGLAEYGILVVDTDGTIAKNDTLKSTGEDRFERPWSITRDDIVETVSSMEFLRYHEAQRPSAAECMSCPDLTVCGGGMPAHRWSSSNGFANPSVFCADQRYLIQWMRSAISTRIAA